MHRNVLKAFHKILSAADQTRKRMLETMAYFKNIFAKSLSLFPQKTETYNVNFPTRNAYVITVHILYY